MLTMFISKNKFFPKVPVSKNLEIFDLLQLSRRELESKNICLQTIRRLDSWKKIQQTNNGRVHKLYTRMEGAFLRRQAQDAVLFYRLIKTYRMRVFRDYMQKLPSVHRAWGAMS